MVNDDIGRLETLVELRRKEAIKKDLGKKVLKVSETLCKKIYFLRQHCSTTYSKGDLEASIEYKDRVFINYKEMLVFSQEINSVGPILKDWLDVKAYIPGDWEKELDEAYERALKLINYRERRNYAPRRKYLRETFAL